MNLIGDGFDICGHIVNEFPTRFSVKDNIGAPSGDEFDTMVIIVLIENTNMRFFAILNLWRRKSLSLGGFHLPVVKTAPFSFISWYYGWM